MSESSSVKLPLFSIEETRRRIAAVKKEIELIRARGQVHKDEVLICEVNIGVGQGRLRGAH